MELTATYTGAYAKTSISFRVDDFAYFADIQVLISTLDCGGPGPLSPKIRVISVSISISLKWPQKYFRAMKMLTGL